MSYGIQFSNLSSLGWTRGMSGSSIDSVLQNLTKSPAAHLMAKSGFEQLVADQSTLSFVATGDIDLYCCWYEPVSKQRFGVRLLVPIQVFGIGPAPRWEVMSDSGTTTAAPNWVSSGNDPSKVYEWTGVDGFLIRGSPTAGHSSLTIEVTVRDAKGSVKIGGGFP
jgi:hypothetical protein